MDGKLAAAQAGLSGREKAVYDFHRVFSHNLMFSLKSMIFAKSVKILFPSCNGGCEGFNHHKISFAMKTFLKL